MQVSRGFIGLVVLSSATFCAGIAMADAPAAATLPIVDARRSVERTRGESPRDGDARRDLGRPTLIFVNAVQDQMLEARLSNADVEIRTAQDAASELTRVLASPSDPMFTSRVRVLVRAIVHNVDGARGRIREAQASMEEQGVVALVERLSALTQSIDRVEEIVERLARANLATSANAVALSEPLAATVDSFDVVRRGIANLSSAVRAR